MDGTRGSTGRIPELQHLIISTGNTNNDSQHYFLSRKCGLLFVMQCVVHQRHKSQNFQETESTIMVHSFGQSRVEQLKLDISHAVFVIFLLSSLCAVSQYHMSTGTKAVKAGTKSSAAVRLLLRPVSRPLLRLLPRPLQRPVPVELKVQIKSI